MKGILQLTLVLVLFGLLCTFAEDDDYWWYFRSSSYDNKELPEYLTFTAYTKGVRVFEHNWHDAFSLPPVEGMLCLYTVPYTYHNPLDLNCVLFTADDATYSWKEGCITRNDEIYGISVSYYEKIKDDDDKLKHIQYIDFHPCLTKKALSIEGAFYSELIENCPSLKLCTIHRKLPKGIKSLLLEKCMFCWEDEIAFPNIYQALEGLQKGGFPLGTDLLNKCGHNFLDNPPSVIMEGEDYASYKGKYLSVQVFKSEHVTQLCKMLSSGTVKHLMLSAFHISREELAEIINCAQFKTLIFHRNMSDNYDGSWEPLVAKQDIENLAIDMCNNYESYDSSGQRAKNPGLPDLLYGPSTRYIEGNLPGPGAYPGIKYAKFHVIPKDLKEFVPNLEYLVVDVSGGSDIEKIPETLKRLFVATSFYLEEPKKGKYSVFENLSSIYITELFLRTENTEAYSGFFDSAMEIGIWGYEYATLKGVDNFWQMIAKKERNSVDVMLNHSITPQNVSGIVCYELNIWGCPKLADVELPNAKKVLKCEIKIEGEPKKYTSLTTFPWILKTKSTPEFIFQCQAYLMQFGRVTYNENLRM